MILVAGTARALPAAAASNEGPGRLGLVEGEATIERAGVQKAVEEGGPLLPGDRLVTVANARVEIVLSDAAAVFVAGDAALVFATLAGVGDEGDMNLLLLERGELLLASEGETETRIDTHNASVYAGAGSYRIERAGDATLVVARRGAAELRTQRGVVWVGAQEQGTVAGDEIPTVARAGDADALERWAAELGERGERLAFTFEDESDLGLGYDDFGFGFWSWDDGGSVCVRGCGGSAFRTRPPQPPAGPGSADDPGRWAQPIGPEGSAGDEVEVAVDKPWPLGPMNQPDDGEFPIEKPDLGEVLDDASVDGAYLDAGDAESTDPKPSDAEPASFDEEPAWLGVEPEAVIEHVSFGAPTVTTDDSTTSDSMTTDDSSSGYDSAPASDAGASASPPPDPPSPDAAVEPNR